MEEVGPLFSRVRQASQTESFNILLQHPRGFTDRDLHHQICNYHPQQGPYENTLINFQISICNLGSSFLRRLLSVVFMDSTSL